MSVLLYSFTSHIYGKNARARVYDDKVEWERPRGVSGAKVTAGILTMGLSLAATGVKNGKGGSEMIPIKNITSVLTKRDGMMNSIVQFVTSGNSIEFRVSHAEAEIVRSMVSRLILGHHVDPYNPGSIVPTAPPLTQAPAHQPPPVLAPPAPAAPAVPASDDVLAQLAKLGELKSSGVLSDEEFATMKAQLLARLA